MLTFASVWHIPRRGPSFRPPCSQSGFLPLLLVEGVTSTVFLHSLQTAPKHSPRAEPCDDPCVPDLEVLLAALLLHCPAWTPISCEKEKPSSAPSRFRILQDVEETVDDFLFRGGRHCLEKGADFSAQAPSTFLPTHRSFSEPSHPVWRSVWSHHQKIRSHQGPVQSFRTSSRTLMTPSMRPPSQPWQCPMTWPAAGQEDDSSLETARQSAWL